MGRSDTTTQRAKISQLSIKSKPKQTEILCNRTTPLFCSVLFCSVLFCSCRVVSCRVVVSCNDVLSRQGSGEGFWRIISNDAVRSSNRSREDAIDATENKREHHTSQPQLTRERSLFRSLALTVAFGIESTAIDIRCFALPCASPPFFAPNLFYPEPYVRCNSKNVDGEGGNPSLETGQPKIDSRVDTNNS
jgi:hypothetical protein